MSAMNFSILGKCFYFYFVLRNIGKCPYSFGTPILGVLGESTVIKRVVLLKFQLSIAKIYIENFHSSSTLFFFFNLLAGFLLPGTCLQISSLTASL